MRVSDSCFLVLLLFLLICIFESDLRRAFWSSGTPLHSILLMKYHRADRLDSMEKLHQINLEKEVSYGGIISHVGATLEHKNLIHDGRKLLMKHGVRRRVEEVSKSNTDDKHTKNKRSNQRRGNRSRSRSMKRLKKKGRHDHQRHYERGVGAFTEDYRVPRPHPPRNN